MNEICHSLGYQQDGVNQFYRLEGEKKAVKIDFLSDSQEVRIKYGESSTLFTDIPSLKRRLVALEKKFLSLSSISSIPRPLQDALIQEEVV